jgi:dTMP kinase
MDKLRNKLIVFEGGDRTGKSSVAQLLNKHLNDNDIPSILTFQPGDTRWGIEATIMRSLCKDKRHNLHPLSNFFAFLLDRVEVTDKIVNPYLADGYTVISDRWHYSTVAYQLHGKQLLEKYQMPKDVLEWLNDLAIQSKEPDLVVYFPEKLEVYRDSDDNDQFENVEDTFFDRVHKAYEEMAQRDNWLRMLPGDSEKDTFANLLEKLDVLGQM